MVGGELLDFPPIKEMVEVLSFTLARPPPLAFALEAKGCTPGLLSGRVRRVNTQHGSLLHPGHTGLFCPAALVEGAVRKVLIWVPRLLAPR